MGDSLTYPLVIRNTVPLFNRGFMLLFFGTAVLITYVAARDGPPQPDKWWPLIMLAFWFAGIFGLWWSFDQEAAVIRITNPGSIHIWRGKAFRREEHWTDRARLWIEDTKDSEGDPYFKLWMDAPGGKLTIKEGHRRVALENLQARVEAAIAGREMQ